MKKKKLHITEIYSIKNGKNLKARRLLADFLGVDQKECKIPLNRCSTVLRKFVSNYNQLVSKANIKEKDRQEVLF